MANVVVEVEPRDLIPNGKLAGLKAAGSWRLLGGANSQTRPLAGELTKSQDRSVPWGKKGSAADALE